MIQENTKGKVLYTADPFVLFAVIFYGMHRQLALLPPPLLLIRYLSLMVETILRSCNSRAIMQPLKVCLNYHATATSQQGYVTLTSLSHCQLLSNNNKTTISNLRAYRGVSFTPIACSFYLPNTSADTGGLPRQTLYLLGVQVVKTAHAA